MYNNKPEGCLLGLGLSVYWLLQSWPSLLIVSILTHGRCVEPDVRCVLIVNVEAKSDQSGWCARQSACNMEWFNPSSEWSWKRDRSNLVVSAVISCSSLNKVLTVGAQWETSPGSVHFGVCFWTLQHCVRLCENMFSCSRQQWTYVYVLAVFQG